ncbi:MAG: nucleotide-binding universal stress UspA family protein [Pseudohongiellaceae bacterium]|jgi:nucleotide-binding universal stress UspA family protein
MGYKTILAEVDLTLESGKILDVAKSLVDGNVRSVYAVYVVKPSSPSLPVTTYLQGLSDEYSEMVVEARKRLKAICDSAGIPRDNQLILVGSRSKEIPFQASKINAKLLVVGKHTQSFLGKLFSPTGTDIAKSTECDVLAVNVVNSERVDVKRIVNQDLSMAMIKSPTKYFEHPKQIAEYPGLDQSQRIKILRAWKHDIISLMKATEENLGSGDNNELEFLNDALGKEISQHQ